MYLHFQKTSAMWVGVWQTLQGLDFLDIYLPNDKIQQVESQKLLGLEIDRSLNWFLTRSDEHFTSIKWCNNRSYCDKSFRSASVLNTRKVLFYVSICFRKYRKKILLS